MLFKFSNPTSVGQSWIMVDGFDEVRWEKAYVIKHDDDKSNFAYSVTRKLPKDCKPDEPREAMQPELYISPFCRGQLDAGEVDHIQVALVSLLKQENEGTYAKRAVRCLAVHTGYVLNDHGQTVEKVMS